MSRPRLILASLLAVALLIQPAAGEHLTTGISAFAAGADRGYRPLIMRG